jgi:hypothetical protein
MYRTKKFVCFVEIGGIRATERYWVRPGQEDSNSGRDTLQISKSSR